MMRLMIPVLRADFQVIQTYHYAAESPLDCPIIAFGGDCDEDATPEQMQAWRAQTNADFVAHAARRPLLLTHSAIVAPASAGAGALPTRQNSRLSVGHWLRGLTLAWRRPATMKMWGVPTFSREEHS
jgi:hypothetical protein